MAADGAAGVDIEQAGNEEAERFALLGGAGVGGGAIRKQATFVGNADAAGVEAADVGADAIERAHGGDDAVEGDVEVVSASGESALAVEAVECFRCEATIAAGGGTMYYDQIDSAGGVEAQLLQAVGGHHADGGRDGLGDKYCFGHNWLKGFRLANENLLAHLINEASRMVLIHVRTVSRRRRLSGLFDEASIRGRSGDNGCRRGLAAVRGNLLSRL